MEHTKDDLPSQKALAEAMAHIHMAGNHLYMANYFASVRGDYNTANNALSKAMGDIAKAVVTIMGEDVVVQIMKPTGHVHTGTVI